MSHITKTIFFLLISILFSSVYAQSSSEIAATIKETKQPLERTLNAIDKLHLSKLSLSEQKMALSSNMALQKDIYKRMVFYRDQIKAFSLKTKSKESVEELKVFLADYNSKLVRVVSILFNFHKLFGGFPTMAQVRSLNLRLDKDAFVKIADFGNMKAKHIADDEVEIQVKEMEYLQIASTTYLSNAQNKKKDFAHLVQFMATQQTLVNRGQLSKMDASSILNEQPINQCMQRNLLIGEKRNFKISEHALNQEDKTTRFYSDFIRAAGGPVLRDLADEQFFTVTEAHKTYEVMRANKIGEKLFSKEAAISIIENSIVNRNAQLPEEEKMVAFSTWSQEAKDEQINKYFEYQEKSIPKQIFKVFKDFFKKQELSQYMISSFLSGDEINKEDFLKRVRKSYELDFYSELGNFLREVDQTQSKMNLDAFAPIVTKMMNRWESKLEVILDKHLPKFSANTRTKTEQLETYLDQELLKVYPFAKSLYFTRFAEKSGEKINEIYSSHPQKRNMTIIPDNPSDLISLEEGKPYVQDYELCPEVAQKITTSFHMEVQQAYNELLPFTELVGANPLKFFTQADGKVILDNDNLDKVIFAHIGEFVEKRAYPKNLKNRLHSNFMNVFEQQFESIFKVEMNELVFNRDVFHAALEISLGKYKDAEPFLNEVKQAIYPQFSQLATEYSDQLINADTQAIDRDQLTKVFGPMVQRYVDGLGYPADLKNKIYLQKQFAELLAYAESGDEKFLSARVKRFLVSKSGHNGGRYGKGTAKAILEAGNQKRLYNSMRENESTSKLIASLKKESAAREALMWNITLWKLGEYTQGFGVDSEIVSELSQKKPDFSKLQNFNKNLRQISELQRTRAKACKTQTGSVDRKDTLDKTVSGYSSEQVKIVSHRVKQAAATTTVNFERPNDLFKNSETNGKYNFGNPLLNNKMGFKAVLKGMIKRFGLQEGFRDAIIANGSNDIKPKYWLSGRKQALVAKNRLNELYAVSYMMRTPYELGTTGQNEPTAFRLLKAFDISRADGFDQYEAKQVIKETVEQALRNSKMLAEKWCMADYEASSGSNGETYFREIYRHAPLIREQVLTEIEMIESRRSKDVSGFMESLRKIDSYLDKDSKTTLERIHESIEMVAMIAGVIMLLAMMVWGIGFFVGGAVFALGKAGMALTMNHLIFAFFIVSFASRMHHIYFRVPAQLDLQHKIATTQIIKPLYTNWDELEEKMSENSKERTGGWQITAHIAEGAFQGLFAFQIARIPYVRYSASKMVSIMNKMHLPIQTIVKPLHKVKNVRLVNLFKPTHFKMNMRTFGKMMDNVVTKILKPKVFLGGQSKQRVAEVVQMGLKNRTYVIATKHFSPKGDFAQDPLRVLSKSLKSRVKRTHTTTTTKIKVTNLEEISGSVGEYKTGATEFVEYVHKTKMSAHKNASKGTQGILDDIITDGKEVLKKRNVFEDIVHSLNKTRFFTRAKIKAWRNGDHKIIGNSKLKQLKQSREELAKEFEAMTQRVQDQKDLINENMAKKIDKVLDLLNSGDESANAYRGRTALEVLFGSKDPALAFNAMEIQQFSMMALTSRNFGSAAAKWDYAVMLMSDFPILARRLKAESELFEFVMPKAAQSLASGSKNLEKAPSVDELVQDMKLLGEATEISQEQTQAFIKQDILSTLVGEPVFKFRFKDYLNHGVDKINKGSSKKTMMAISLMIASAMLQDEIGYRFDQFKTWWEQTTGESWAGIEQIISENSFDEVLDTIESSGLLNSDEIDSFINEYEAVFKDGHKTLKALDQEAREYEAYEDIKYSLDSLMTNSKPEKVEYMQRYELLKAEADSLGISAELETEMDKVEDLINTFSEMN